MTTKVPGVGEAAVDVLAAERVRRHLESLIETGGLRPGDRLPAERELAQRVGVSRPTLRAGLRSLVALGIIESRQGAGNFVTDGPPRLSAGPLSLLAALHGFTRDDVFEARLVLEVAAAGLAAERAMGDDLAAMAEEIAGMFASLDEPETFLLYDVRFHRAIAVASGNPVVAALVDMVSAVVYERRRLTVRRARDLKQSAEMHRHIYAAIRDRNPERAREEMSRHLDQARNAQASEEAPFARVSRAEGEPQPRAASGERRARRRVPRD